MWCNWSIVGRGRGRGGYRGRGRGFRPNGPIQAAAWGTEWASKSTMQISQVMDAFSYLCFFYFILIFLLVLFRVCTNT